MSIKGKIFTNVFVLLMIGFTIAVCSWANCMYASEPCGNQNFDGAYVVSINGFRTFQPPPQLVGAFAPVAVIGTFTFDGGGNVSRNVTVIYGGQEILVSDKGTYIVNPDCTGSASFSEVGDAFSLVSLDTRTISIVTATPGASGAGTLVKQQIRSCSQRRLQGTFVFNGNGWGAFQDPPQLVDAFFPVSVSGTWTLDGKGSVSRNLNLSFFGFVFPYQDSGTYQVNSDCTASAYFPNDNEPFAMVFVDTSRLVTSTGSVPGVSRAGAGTLTKQRLDD